MILTVTLNAAIDRTLAVPNFRLGRRHRAVEQTAIAGGKGVNVARALKALGRPVLATGTAGGGAGARIIEMLDDEGIANDFVRIADESRMSTAVIDPTDGVTTEVNERGPALSSAERERAVERILYLAQGARICVLCGSLPRGVPVELYAQLVEELHKLGVTTILDTEGEPLRRGHARRPRPGHAEPDRGRGARRPRVRRRRGPPGRRARDRRDGRARRDHHLRRAAAWRCWAATPPSAWRCRVAVEPLEPISPIGSGDAFLAGYVAGLYDGRPAEECVRFATACGAESVRHVGAGVLDPREVERLLPDITRRPPGSD